MTSFRLATIIFIVGAGLVGSYFIIFDSMPSIPAENKPISQSIGGQSATSSPLQWAEGAKELNPVNNFTLALGQTLVEQIQLSPNIFDFEKGNLSAGAGVLSNKLINNAFTDNQLGLVFALDEKVLKISSDNSVKSKANYLKMLDELTKKNSTGFNKSYFRVIYETYGENNPSSAVQLADIYQNLAKEISALSAPGDYFKLHKRIILSYKNAEVVYRAMAGYSQDPIKGYLALEMVQGLVSGIEEIQKTLSAKAKEVKLY